MKTTLLFSLFIAFLLFVLTTKPLDAAAADPVLDITGKPLRTGINYYILPVIRGRGGGLTLASSNKTCPQSVAQDQFEVSNGLPLSFSPVTLIRGVIRVSTDNNIKFSATTICKESTTVWKLGSYDELTKQWFVTTGGVLGNPGRSTTGNWFKIEKYQDDYKLVFCPSVCDFCKVLCRDVGIFIKDGRRRLALSDVPFIVMFKKA